MTGLQSGVGWRWLSVTVAFALLAVGVGGWVYRDARSRDREAAAPFVAFAVGGLFLAGGLPGLVTLAVTGGAASQGYPTALRVVPGVLALAVYLRLR